MKYIQTTFVDFDAFASNDEQKRFCSFVLSQFVAYCHENGLTYQSALAQLSKGVAGEFPETTYFSQVATHYWDAHSWAICEIALATSQSCRNPYDLTITAIDAVIAEIRAQLGE